MFVRDFSYFVTRYLLGHFYEGISKDSSPLTCQAVTTGKDPLTFRKTSFVLTWDETVQIDRLFVFKLFLIFEYADIRLFRNDDKYLGVGTG